MKLMIVHLSDVHVRTASDVILSRADKVADALRGLCDDADCLLIALTGDVAFSGKEEEYELASAWLADLQSRLSAILPSSTILRIAFVPGNHDCDFTKGSPARATLIDALGHDPSLAEDQVTVKVCTEPQTAFFRFRDQQASVDLEDGSALYYEYRIDLNEVESIRVRCCNTAWVSQLPENPAKLTFPEKAIPEPTPGAATRDALVVTLMHHTYNWLVPSNMRSVRRKLQAVSDFILTGHEHEFGVSQLRDEAGGTSVHVEGLALQGHTHGIPTGFNVIVVDTSAKLYTVTSLLWTVTRYVPQDNEACASWTSYTANPLRAGHVFPLATAMGAHLSDPGITLLHPVRGRLLLQDIYVPPDLREVISGPGGANTNVIGAEQVFQLAVTSGRLLVTGADQSGKSVLAKRLFIEALEDGRVPLLLDGKSVRLKGTQRDRRELARVFADQYAENEETFASLERDRCVIIVDDVSSLRASGTDAVGIIEHLASVAAVVILVAEDIAQLVQDITGLAPLARGREPFRHFRLLPVGHVRREELIDRYVDLAAYNDAVRAEDLRADMRRILGVAVGKYSAPATPLAVVSILQARAFNETLNLQHSTYGYYYELLIKRQLIGQSGSVQEIDLQLAYLTELAHSVLLLGEREWDEAWMMEFHAAFVTTRKLTFPFRNAIDLLVARGILELRGDRIAFLHSYLFHYFAARALGERLSTSEGRARVVALTEHLDQQENADILLFLTHHSKDPAVIDPMLAQADSLFDDVSPSELAAVEVAIAGLETALRGAVYEDGPIREQRRTYLQKLDETTRDTGEHAANTGNVAKPDSEGRAERDAEVQRIVAIVARVGKAFRTMQILGQVLKNFPGALSGDQKERITRAVYGVARRTLRFIHEFIKAHSEAVAAMVVDQLRHDHPDVSVTELMAAARVAIHWQLYMTAYGMVQRTASDVESPLLDPVFKEVAASTDAPVVGLISVALQLHRAGSFPDAAVREMYKTLDGNPMAQRILRSLVITHFHLFDVQREVKQSICALLDIDYKPLPPGSKTRLISNVAARRA